MVELKKDEKNGVLPTINALKWFIKKQITKCRKSCLGYLCVSRHFRTVKPESEQTFIIF